MNTELKERAEAILREHKLSVPYPLNKETLLSAMIDFHKQELSRLREIDIENAAKHYAMTNYARAEKQSIEDASYIQGVSYHTFKGAIDWLKKLSLEEKIIEGAEAKESDTTTATEN